MKPKRDFIWTPEMAYVVGLIATDGCLSGDGRHISFTSKDINLIETFASILNLRNKIGVTKNVTCWTPRIQFCDVQFYRWLLTIGLISRKSKTLGAISVPAEYFIDFLRGHLDGDGSITTYSDTYNTYKKSKYVYQRLFIRFISASQKHIEWLSNKNFEITEIQGRCHTTKTDVRTGNIMYILKFGKKDSLNLLRKIYYAPNLPSLNRKRELAEKCLTSPLLLLKKPKSPIVRI